MDGQPTLRLLADLAHGEPGSPAIRLRSNPTLRVAFHMANLPPGRAWRIADGIRDGELRVGTSIEERRFARYISQLKSLETGVTESLAKLKNAFSRIRRRSAEEAQSLLPARVGLERARVVFVPLHFDAMVDRTTVYFDPLLALMVGERGVTRVLTHEFHHIGRFLLTGENISGINPRLDPRHLTWTGLIRFWASLLELEGVADLVFDVKDLALPVYRPMMARRECVTSTCARHLRRAERILLDRPVNSRAERRAIGRAVQILLRDGHPLGKRLAEAILDEFGKPRLIQCVGRPERFFRAYQDAAANSGLFRFSEELLASIPS